MKFTHSGFIKIGRRPLRILITSALLLLGASTALPQEGTPETDAPDFHKVYRLIEENLMNTTGEELNRLALRCLLAELNPQVQLVGTGEEPGGGDEDLQITFNRYAGKFACLHLNRINSESVTQIQEMWSAMETNQPALGLILDLRFTGGTDYQAATDLAALFATDQAPSLQSGDRTLSGELPDSPIDIPVAVLINQQTRGGAEAVAALLRQMKAALIIGRNSAGEAAGYQSFPLENGMILRISSEIVRLGNGDSLSGESVQPDLTVEVSIEDERLYLEDPYGEEMEGTDATPVRRRVREADLVRQRREGKSLQEILEESGTETTTRVIRDPVLSRALDLLKGLSVTQAWEER